MPAANPDKLTPDAEMLRSLQRHGLLKDVKNATFEVLTGGVSSDIWKVNAQFPRADIFQAIRLEPYLKATATRHTDLKGQLFSLSRRTADIALTMIHGDVSPKNILLGPDGPVFLDAECACMGDPAFDIAFCLNHFLLKWLWTPSAKRDFIACFGAMASSN